MNWKQIATIALGAGLLAAGTLVPGLQVLAPIGTGVVGLALPQVFGAAKKHR